MQAARRWGAIWPAALVGLLTGAAVGFPGGPNVIAVPGLLALSGLALGLLIGLPLAWRRPPKRAAMPTPTIGRHVAEVPPLAPPPPGGDLAPGWYPDPRHSGARRYWDGEHWTEHLWRDRERRTGRVRSRS
jgi:hypothetical protein